MAIERGQKEINFCLDAHDAELHGFNAKIPMEDIPTILSVNSSPVIDLYNGSETKFLDPKSHTDQLASDVTDEPSLSDEIQEIFKEDQERVLGFNMPQNGNTLVYALLDEQYIQGNPDSPREIIEDDYSPDSRP